MHRDERLIGTWMRRGADNYPFLSFTVTLLTAVILTALSSLCDAADPECVYRKIRGLSLHWPNPTSCESYYRCSSKNTVRGITCPAGKEYNPRNGKCATAGRGLCTLTLAAPLAEVCPPACPVHHLPSLTHPNNLSVVNKRMR